MSILDSLPHTATARRRVRTKDALGAGRDSLASAALFTDRVCWRQPASDSEATDFRKRGISLAGKVYFTEDPELDENYVLVVGGQEYDVVSAPEPDASLGLGIVWRVMITRRTTED